MLLRLARHVRVWWSLMNDKHTPRLSKLLPFAGIFYVLVPFDLIPDVLPLLGQLDDAGVILILFTIAFHLIPRDLRQEYEQKAHRMDVIDV